MLARSSYQLEIWILFISFFDRRCFMCASQLPALEIHQLRTLYKFLTKFVGEEQLTFNSEKSRAEVISSTCLNMGMDDARVGHEEEVVVGSVVVLDGSTVREFATDEKAFTSAIDKMFASLDSNGDGVLSRTEIRPAFERLNLEEMRFGVPVTKTTDEVNALYDSVFDTFDTDHNNKVDLMEFRSQLKEILLAIADGLGFAPLTMMVEHGSLLQNAVEHETNTCCSWPITN